VDISPPPATLHLMSRGRQHQSTRGERHSGDSMARRSIPSQRGRLLRSSIQRSVQRLIDCVRRASPTERARAWSRETGRMVSAAIVRSALAQGQKTPDSKGHPYGAFVPCASFCAPSRHAAAQRRSAGRARAGSLRMPTRAPSRTRRTARTRSPSASSRASSLVRLPTGYGQVAGFVMPCDLRVPRHQGTGLHKRDREERTPRWPLTPLRRVPRGATVSPVHSPRVRRRVRFRAPSPRRRGESCVFCFLISV
jgi:hypothetical protein